MREPEHNDTYLSTLESVVQSAESGIERDEYPPLLLGEFYDMKIIQMSKSEGQKRNHIEFESVDKI